MSAGIDIRDIERLDDVRAAEDLQKEVWGLADRDIVPLTQLVAARETGGALIGAWDQRALIGFVYGFVGREHGRTVHHSHMLAVKPEYRNRDVGFRLKLAQRQQALGQNIDRMSWTFDPLQSLNAHFNFCKLGVVSETYKINFYGDETSSFLHRIGTDRLWLTWLLDSRRVLQRLQGIPDAQQMQSELPALVQVGTDGSPRELEYQQGQSGEQVLIEIPADINALQQQNPEQAVRWREATRRVFTEALDSAFLVEDFFRRTRGGQSVGVYRLSRGRTIEDFV